MGVSDRTEPFRGSVRHAEQTCRERSGLLDWRRTLLNSIVTSRRGRLGSASLNRAASMITGSASRGLTSFLAVDTSNALNAAWSLIQPRVARRLFGMPNNAVAGGTRSGRAASTSLSPRFEQVAKTTSGVVTFCAGPVFGKPNTGRCEALRLEPSVVFGMTNTCVCLRRWSLGAARACSACRTPPLCAPSRNGSDRIASRFLPHARPSARSLSVGAPRVR